MDREPSEIESNEGGPTGRRHGRRRARRIVVAVTLLVAVAVGAAVALVGVAVGRPSSSAGATITVTGSGTVKGRPDTVVFQMGVTTTESTAAAALSANNAQTRQLEATLLKNGATKAELQTSDLNIYDRTNNAGEITGFVASDDLTVTMHDLTAAGKAIDAATAAVGNDIQFNGVTLSISNKSKLLAAARAEAMDNAHAMASQLAAGGHEHLGTIVKVVDNESTGSTGIVYPFANATELAGSSVPLEGGTESLNVTVKVVYRLNP